MALPTTYLSSWNSQGIAYTLTASADGGYIEGSNLRDSFLGGAGNDTFYGRSGGGDDYEGGGGFNQINLDGTVADYTFTRTGDDTFTIQRDGWKPSWAYDIDGVYFVDDGEWLPTEHLFRNAAGEHVLTASSAGGVLTGTDFVDRFIGAAGVDTFYGKNGNDILLAAAGNDRLDGGAGADRMEGGTGNDTFWVDNAGDVVVETNGQGTDRVYSSVSFGLFGGHVEHLTLTGSAAINASGNDLANTLTGNGAANILSGVGGNDILLGAGGNDTLYGGLGADRMEGGAGNDTFSVDNARDVVVEANGQGTDLVNSSLSFSLIGRHVEHVTLTGSFAINATGNDLANRLTGNDNANVLAGRGGNDTLIGGAGRDTLDGGTGNDVLIGINVLVRGLGPREDADTLIGGAGNDRFVFGGYLYKGRDTVRDFANLSGNNDTIVLDTSGGVFAPLHAGNLKAENFRLGANALDANDYIIYNKSTGTLYYDHDGSGSSVATSFAAFSNHAALTVADFIII